MPPTCTFTARLRDDGSLGIPEQALAELGVHPGDALQVCLEAANGIASERSGEQHELHEKFANFLRRVETAKFDGPCVVRSEDVAEAGFGAAMEEKFRRLGFKR